MNNQIMQMLNQIKNIKNPKEAAIKTLEQAANQGNPMAKNMLQKINNGDILSSSSFRWKGWHFSLLLWCKPSSIYRCISFSYMSFLLF